MTTVQPTATTPAATSSVGTKTAKNMNEAQDRFLKLLVSQMKNQDPMNPMDNAQVTSQMAQISTVTGIGQLNDTISGFLGKLSGLESLQGASLSGRQVLVSGDSLELANGAATAGFELPAAADDVTMTVKDSSGRTLYRNNLGKQTAGVHSFGWNGLTTTGNRVADGRYTFTVEATAAGTNLPATTLSYGKVNGVTSATNGLQLDLGSLGIRSYSDVKQVQ